VSSGAGREPEFVVHRRRFGKCDESAVRAEWIFGPNDRSWAGAIFRPRLRAAALSILIGWR
jgi:hypothetical protein